MAQFIDPFPGMAPDRKLTKRELSRAIRQAIAAEEEAVHLYEAIVDVIDDALAKKVFQDIANEEKVHIGEFQELLQRIVGDEEHWINEGVEEVEEMSRISKELIKIAKILA
jgi:rubrerythrin